MVMPMRTTGTAWITWRLPGGWRKPPREMEIAREMDPLSGIIREGMAFVRALSRKYDEAIEAYEDLIEFDPSFYKAHTSMGRAYLLKGMYAEAIGKLEDGRALAGDVVPSILGALERPTRAWGNHPEARRILAELHRAAPRRPVHSTCFAVIHLGLGEKDEAFQWLGTRRCRP